VLPEGGAPDAMAPWPYGAASDDADQHLLRSLLPRHGHGLTLSASDIETYRACPLRYKFGRLLRIPVEPTPQQRFGIVVHQVLERYHSGRGPTADAPAEAVPGTLLRLLEAAWRRAGFGGDERDAEWLEKARAALVAYHHQLADHDGAPVWFERTFAFRVGPHLIRGRVDRVDRLPDGTYELIDYKTGHPRTSAQLAGDIQLPLYALAAQRAWEVRASRQSYYYILDNLKVPLPAQPEQERLREITDAVLEVGAGITALRFGAQPSYSVCSSCDYLSICPAAET
jgi:RecB family exonuclease